MYIQDSTMLGLGHLVICCPLCLHNLLPCLLGLTQLWFLLPIPVLLTTLVLLPIPNKVYKGLESFLKYIKVNKLTFMLYIELGLYRCTVGCWRRTTTTHNFPIITTWQNWRRKTSKMLLHFMQVKKHFRRCQLPLLQI